MHSIRLMDVGGQFIREMNDPSKVYLGPSRLETCLRRPD